MTASCVNSVDALRALYPAPGDRAVRRQLAALDVHCRRFIALSPFVVLATAGIHGALDASPRGGAPGFVQVEDARTLLVPDAPGNHRLDSLANIVETGRIGLLFLVPGVDETLRVNGTAIVSTAATDIRRCTDDRRSPKTVVRVMVREAYLHCAKALLRAQLWAATSRIPPSELPSMGEMLKDQLRLTGVAETQDEMAERYAADL